jgi:hypothetical protein
MWQTIRVRLALWFLALLTLLLLVDMETLAAETVAGLQPLAGKRTLRVVRAAPVTALVDPVWFRQLLINLIENAIRHTSEVGTVTVSVAQHGPHAILAVEDQWHRHRARAPSPFVRAFLPGKLGALARRRRCWTRPLHRPVDRLRAPRHDPRHQ